MSDLVAETMLASGFTLVDPVRLRPEITLRAYDIGMRVGHSGIATPTATGEVASDPGGDSCPCPTCKKIAADEARWQPFLENGHGGLHVKAFVARRVVHMDNQFVQNIAEELAGCLPETVDAEKARKGDKVQDNGWIKTIKTVTIGGDQVVFHFEENPYGLQVSYQYGHPALVFRMIDDDEH